MTTDAPQAISNTPQVATGDEYRFVEDDAGLYLVIDGDTEQEERVTMVLPLSIDTLAVFSDVASQYIDDGPEITDEDKTDDGDDEKDKQPWGKRMRSRVKKVTTDPAGLKGLLEANPPQGRIAGLDWPTLAVIVVGVISLLLVVGSWIF